MSILLAVLALLGLAVVAGLLARFIPRVPLPLIQIALGAACSWPALGLHLDISPEVFMLLFIPPLLFSDGWLIPKRELGGEAVPVLLLSTGLVLVTVLVMGWGIYWLVPGMPLSVAFLLAAVLSPTDAVAVSAIVHRQPMPARLRHILEGESLMNDASGLVAVKCALAATLTQAFSPAWAAREFVLMAAGGIAVGALCALVLDRLQHILLRGHETRVDLPAVLFLLLLPFPPYLLAEHFGLSGVLAVVTAGILSSTFAVRRSRFNASHVQGSATSGVVRYAFDAMVFLLLGLQLSSVLRALPEQLNLLDSPLSPMALRLWGLGLTIAAGLLAIRFCGFMVAGWLKRRVPWLRRHDAGEATLRLTAAVGALGGIRGAVTLVAVLNVPLVLPGGLAFPYRGMLIFISVFVIVLTMLAASLLLPPLLQRLAGSAARQGSAHERELRWARRRSTRAALHALSTLQPAAAHDSFAHAFVCSRIDHGYRHRLMQDGLDGRQGEASRELLALECRLRLDLIRQEREELQRLRRGHRINDHTLRALTHELDLVEAVLAQSQDR